MSNVNDPRYARMAYHRPPHDTVPAAWEAGQAVQAAHDRLRSHNDQQQHTRRTHRDIRTGKRLLWAVVVIGTLALGNLAYGTWTAATMRQAPAHVTRVCQSLISRC